MGYASEFGRLPSEVWEDYLEHPLDYRLIFGYRNFVAEEQKKAEQEAKNKNKRPQG